MKLQKIWQYFLMRFKFMIGLKKDKKGTLEKWFPFKGTYQKSFCRIQKNRTWFEFIINRVNMSKRTEKNVAGKKNDFYDSKIVRFWLKQMRFHKSCKFRLMITQNFIPQLKTSLSSKKFHFWKHVKKCNWHLWKVFLVPHL